MNEVVGYVVKFADNTYYATSKVASTHHTDKLRKAKIFLKSTISKILLQNCLYLGIITVILQYQKKYQIQR